MILPDSLANLAKELCPELGGKGDLDHTKVTVDSVSQPECISEYREYLSLDVLLLATILQRNQEFNWNQFQLDIVNYLTLAALSFAIYRMGYYDDDKGRMYLLNENADKFIRRGYYGGHSDVTVRIYSYTTLIRYTHQLWPTARCPEGNLSGMLT